MQFKIMLTPDRPTQGELVLAAETPLSGVTFIEKAGQCLRRSIDHIARYRHVTLGALAIYEISVPQQLAIESGLFDTKSTVSIIVEHDLLSHYIFYGASVDQKSSGRPCYPYMHGETTLTSYIDELQFLEDWADIGYPTRIGWEDGLTNTISQTSINVRPTIGCEGCSCYRGPYHPCTNHDCRSHEHMHHHHHRPPYEEEEHCWECDHSEWHGSVLKPHHHDHKKPRPHHAPPPPPPPLIAHRPDYKIPAPPPNFGPPQKPKPLMRGYKTIL